MIDQDASAYWAQISADYEARIAELLAEVAALKHHAQCALMIREALHLAREYISQDHGGFKEGDGYFEQTGKILQKLNAAFALTSTHDQPIEKTEGGAS